MKKYLFIFNMDTPKPLSVILKGESCMQKVCKANVGNNLFCVREIPVGGDNEKTV